MCGADDIFALDFPRVCRVVLLFRESAFGETNFADCRVDYVSSSVAGLSLDAQQARAYFGGGGVFYW